MIRKIVVKHDIIDEIVERLKQHERLIVAKTLILSGRLSDEEKQAVFNISNSEDEEYFINKIDTAHDNK